MTENIPSSHKIIPLDIKRLRFWVWVFVIISVLGAVKACDRFYRQHNPELPYKQAQKQSRDPMRVVRHQIVNGQDLWIPVPYFMHFAPPDGVTKDVLLVVMYPDLNPITENYTKLWKEGKWVNNVMILFGDRTGRRDMQYMYESFVRGFHATKFVGNIHGLEFYTEPGEGTRGDLYLVKRGQQLDSFIECGEDTVSHAQCTHWIWDKSFIYRISFDKQLLPYWLMIRDKSMALINSFKRNPESQSIDSNGE